MSNNEMIPATNYTALKDFNLAEAMASEMNGMDVSFDRVTIPAAVAPPSNCPASFRAKRTRPRNSPA